MKEMSVCERDECVKEMSMDEGDECEVIYIVGEKLWVRKFVIFKFWLLD